eukprot:jgi/Galph1/6049/GphlegSOOS_G4693.1
MLSSTTVANRNQSSYAVDNVQSRVLAKENTRYESLSSPILRLKGHEGEVFGVDFNPSGDCLASCSFDRTILLWNVFGDCHSFGVLRGHKNAIGSVHWLEDSKLITCSADRNAALWDARQLERIRQLKGHSSFVNDIAVSKNIDCFVAASVSDDKQLIIWDVRTRYPQESILHRYPLLAVALIDDPLTVYCGGIDNRIYVWDLRRSTEDPFLELIGHRDTITGIDVSKDGAYLCTNAMDHTVRIWDVRPFFQGSDADRCLTTLFGASHSFERNLLRCRFSSDGNLVGSGSADKFVYIWDVDSGELKYALPGHDGSVNDVTFHPRKPIVASASSDQTIYLGEMETEENGI